MCCRDPAVLFANHQQSDAGTGFGNKAALNRGQSNGKRFSEAMASDSEDETGNVKTTAAKRKAASAGAKAKPVARATKAAAAEATTDADSEGESAAATGSLRKKDLLDRVGARSKAKKKDIKDVVEATLLVLGEALAAGEELNLPPLGKAKINRQKGVNGGDMYIIKLRRSTGKAASGDDATDDASETLAEAED
jgi:Bacterial DNA-binding protein